MVMLVVDDDTVIASEAACRRFCRIGVLGTRRVTEEPLHVVRLTRMIHERFCCNRGFATATAPTYKVEGTGSLRLDMIERCTIVRNGRLPSSIVPPDSTARPGWHGGDPKHDQGMAGLVKSLCTLLLLAFTSMPPAGGGLSRSTN